MNDKERKAMWVKKHGRSFSIKDFEKLEDENAHTDATLHLVEKYGTRKDVEAIKAIKAIHDSTGYISNPDYDERNRIQHKYYGRLLPTKPDNKSGQNNRKFLNLKERNRSPMELVR